MATVYSAKYSTGTYTYTRVRVDYSGTSATATLLYTRTNTYSGITGTGDPATFTFAGVNTSIANITFRGQQTDAVVGSVSFTISASGGTYSGSTSGYSQLLSFEGSVTIPAVIPSTPILSIGEVTSTSASIIWRCNNYGTSTGTAYLYGGTAPSPTTELSTTTSTSAQTYTQTGLGSGTTYYFRSRAKNSDNTWGPYSPDLIIRTLTPRAKFYGPDNGEAASTMKILGGINGTAQNITKLYGSVNGEAKIIHQSFGHLSYE